MTTPEQITSPTLIERATYWLEHALCDDIGDSITHDLIRALRDELVGATVEVRYTPNAPWAPPDDPCVNCGHKPSYHSSFDAEPCDVRGCDCTELVRPPGPVSVPVDTDENTGRWTVDDGCLTFGTDDDVLGDIHDVAEGARRGHEWALEAYDALVALVGAATAPPTPATAEQVQAALAPGSVITLYDIRRVLDAVAALTSEETDQ